MAPPPASFGDAALHPGGPDRHGAETVVAVTHNFTIQMILCIALGMPPNNFRRLRVDLGSITRLEVSRERVVQLSVNETWHLT